VAVVGAAAVVVRAVTLVIRSLLQLWRALTATSLRQRSSVDLLAEHDRLARALADEPDLRARVAILARVGPIARELHRRGVT